MPGVLPSIWLDTSFGVLGIKGAVIQLGRKQGSLLFSVGPPLKSESLHSATLTSSEHFRILPDSPIPILDKLIFDTPVSIAVAYFK